MTIIQAVILGIIEGITEFLPISSTGHLILASKAMGIADSDFTKSFEIAIQLGAIMAVVVLYWRRLVTHVDTWKKIFTAFLPTAVVGFLLYRFLKDYLLSNAFIVVWALALGGAALIVFELWHVRRTHQAQPLNYKNSFLVGVAQSFSIIPGISRAGATIVGGLLTGISRETIVEFSFLLAVPTMAAATGYDLYRSAGSFSPDQFSVLVIGFVVSFIVAMLAIKWLLNYVKHHTFIAFGIYRIVASFLFWFFVIK